MKSFLFFLFFVLVLVIAGIVYLQVSPSSSTTNEPVVTQGTQPPAEPEPTSPTLEPVVPIHTPVITTIPPPPVPPVEPTLPCIDSCSKDSCSGRRYTACLTGQDGCKSKVSQNYVMGKCGVTCLENTDCSSFLECTNYKCAVPDQNCEDDQCDLGEFGSCTQNCGETTYPYLAAYPAFFFDDGEFRTDVRFIVGDDEPSYQLAAVHILIDYMKSIDPSANYDGAIVKAIDISNPQTYVTIIFGNECDNAYYQSIGRSCNPFSGSTTSLQIVGGTHFSLRVYGNQNTLDEAAQALIEAHENNLKTWIKQV